MGYRERPSSIDGAVVWTRVGAPTPGPARILPDGCMDLIWADGDLMVAGPDTRAHLVTVRAAGKYTGIRFGPGLGPDLFGIPADELRDRRIPLAAVWPGGAVRRLTEQVGDAPSHGVGLERLAAPRMAEPDAVMVEVVRRLRAGVGVAQTADVVGLSERQLLRRSLRHFGYGPKMLARVLRLGRALDLARRGIGFAAVAAVAGYADQAHLARDVRALTGVPLGGLRLDGLQLGEEID